MTSVRAALGNLLWRAREFAWPGQSNSFHRHHQLAAIPDVSRWLPLETGDADLVRRIVHAYQRSSAPELGDSMWRGFFASYHRPIHEALIHGDEAATTEFLRNPGDSDLFYGFDILTKLFRRRFRRARLRRAYARICLDGLVRLGEAIGAIPLDNPESWPSGKGSRWDAESLLAPLQEQLGAFSIPNPYPDEHGLKTSRGIVSARVPQALYQAWRISRLVQGIASPRVLEIGAGLGRTAYHAHALGITDYTIVDIPISAAAQAYFLGRTLGEGKVLLEGEPAPEGSAAARIISPQTFHAEQRSYDLIVNVDSLTEMDVGVARAYWKKIKRSTTRFLSINHEANPFRARDVLGEDLRSVVIERGLYWMRRGYVEELVTIPGA